MFILFNLVLGPAKNIYIFLKNFLNWSEEKYVDEEYILGSRIGLFVIGSRWSELGLGELSLLGPVIGLVD